MKLRYITLSLVAVASLAACSSGSAGGGSAGGPMPPVANPPAVPMPIELAAFARAGMGEAEDSTPKTLNDVELVSSEDNPSEFDDWFQ
jgi:hypothetical protein